MSENKIELSGIFAEGYGINPKKLWKMQLGFHELENKKKVKGIYIKAVLSYMLSYTGGGNECFPSIRTISDDLEVSADIIVNAINAAVELNMITKEQMYPNDPLKHNNKYILQFLPESYRHDVDVRESRTTASDGTNFDIVTFEQNNNILNNIINNIYIHWNSKSIIKHKKLTKKIYNRIKSTLDEHDKKEILSAIDNYDIVFKDDKYYWSHRWTLIDFLKRGIDRFINDAMPLENFIKNKIGDKENKDPDKWFFCVRCKRDMIHYYLNKHYWCKKCEKEYNEDRVRRYKNESM